MSGYEFTEEKQFNLRFSLEARFDENGDDESDGYVWVQEWERGIKPRLVQAVFDLLRREPGWEVRSRNRGASPEEELEIVLVRKP